MKRRYCNWTTNLPSARKKKINLIKTGTLEAAAFGVFFLRPHSGLDGDKNRQNLDVSKIQWRKFST